MFPEGQSGMSMLRCTGIQQQLELTGNAGIDRSHGVDRSVYRIDRSIGRGVPSSRSSAADNRLIATHRPDLGMIHKLLDRS